MTTSPPSGPLTTGDIAGRLDAELVGPADLPITHLDTLESGGPGALTFIRSASYANQWATSQASAALVTDGLTIPGHDEHARALIVVRDADLALIKMINEIGGVGRRPAPGVHPSAVVDETATIAETATIGANCVIGADASIGEGTVLRSLVSVGERASIGAGCTMHPGVVIGHDCVVGDGCAFHSNSVIGADGFGYRPSPDGQGVVKIPHIGNVVIGNGVEIGACSTIDRAKFGSTKIGDGSKLDNLVQLAHGCNVGRSCLLAGNCGMGGSVVLEDGVQVGGKAAISDNVRVGKGSRIAGMASVGRNVPPGTAWFGSPGGPHRMMVANYAALRGLADFMRTASGKKPRFQDP